MGRHRGQKPWKAPCGVVLMSWIVQAFAIAFVVVGMAVLGIAIWSMIELGNLSDLASFYLPIGIIVLGVTVTVLALLICGAARRKSICFLGFCSFLLVCVILAQLGVTIALFVSQGSLINAFQSSWIALGTTNAGTQTKVNVEKTFQCCGWSNKTASQDTAAIAAVPQCASDPPQWTSYCKHVINEYIDKNLQWIAVSAAVLLAVEFLGLFALVCMCCGLRNAKEDYESEALISDARRRRDARKESSGVRPEPRYNNYDSSSYMAQPSPSKNQRGWEPL